MIVLVITREGNMQDARVSRRCWTCKTLRMRKGQLCLLVRPWHSKEVPGKGLKDERV